MPTFGFFDFTNQFSCIWLLKKQKRVWKNTFKHLVQKIFKKQITISVQQFQINYTIENQNNILKDEIYEIIYMLILLFNINISNYFINNYTSVLKDQDILFSFQKSDRIFQNPTLKDLIFALEFSCAEYKFLLDLENRFHIDRIYFDDCIEKYVLKKNNYIYSNHEVLKLCGLQILQSKLFKTIKRIQKINTIIENILFLFFQQCIYYIEKKDEKVKNIFQSFLKEVIQKIHILSYYIKNTIKNSTNFPIEINILYFQTLLLKLKDVIKCGQIKIN